MTAEELGAKPEGYLLPGGFVFPEDLFVGFPVRRWSSPDKVVFVEGSSRQRCLIAGESVRAVDLLSSACDEDATAEEAALESLPAGRNGISAAQQRILTLAIAAATRVCLDESVGDSCATNLVSLNPKLRILNNTTVLSFNQRGSLIARAFWPGYGGGIPNLRPKSMMWLLRQVLSRKVRTYAVPWDGWGCAHDNWHGPTPWGREDKEGFYAAMAVARKKRLIAEGLLDPRAV